MAATLELKYFNSFWIKKMDTITEVKPTSGVVAAPAPVDTKVVTLESFNDNIGIGQMFVDSNGTIITDVYVESISMNNGVPPYTVTLTGNVTLNEGDTVIFGAIEDFTQIPRAYGITQVSDWYLEESRIRGGYNNTTVDLGVKAYIVEDDPDQNHRSNSLIYSGIFNSRTGINQTNEFSTAEEITRAVDPSNGSIQKLYAEDTNLVIFQEGKVNKALIDKDAIYTAEGGQLTASGAQIIGQIVPYAGKYGISTNPESFSVYGYRKYFADRVRNSILRLSQDGITEISNYGMVDYFRDNLAEVTNDNLIIGGWDMHNKNYTVHLQGPGKTLSFDESVLGWTSTYTYSPERLSSLRNNFYSFKDGGIYKHYSYDVPRANFYGSQGESSVIFIFNPSVSLVKTFKTINYEGSNFWRMSGFVTNGYYDLDVDGASGNPQVGEPDTAFPIYPGTLPTTLADMENQLFSNTFKSKEGKYFANLLNVTSVNPGEINYGQDITGVKGFFATVKMTSQNPDTSAKTELFAVSSNYIESSY